MTIRTPLAAGERIESRCRRCDDITGHIIVAMVGGEIYKVECQACRSVHRFHPPHGAPAKSRSANAASRPSAARAPSAAVQERPRAGSVKALTIENTWRDAINRHIGAAKPYAMDGSFEAGDLISHPTFGQGIVQSVEKPNKINVLFQDGLRSLRCAL